jgi:acyl-CoA hydrolase
MEIQEKIRISETRLQKIIFQDTLNDQGILFGGYALKWMDEIAYLTATKYTQQKVVTVSVDKVTFLLPVPLGVWIEIKGKVLSAGNVKVQIGVEIWMTGMQDNTSQLAVKGLFTFAAIDETGMPVRLFEIENQS